MFGLEKKDARLLMLVAVLVALAPFILNPFLKGPAWRNSTQAILT